jgi:hypothetical protein
MKSKIKVLVDLGLLRAYFLESNGYLLVVLSHGRKRTRELSGNFFFARALFHAHNLVTSQRSHIIVLSYWGLELQYGSLRWGHKHKSCIPPEVGLKEGFPRMLFLSEAIREPM